MSNDSIYKLRKRVKELETQLEQTKKERNDFRATIAEIFDCAIKHETISSKWILSNFRSFVLKIKYF